MIIGELIKYGSNFIGRDIKDVIITVPSYFNSLQREAIRETGMIDGVNVLRIVNKETTGCYSYGLDKKNKNILIFIMWSNETNVTILNLKDSIFEIKRTYNLGGNILTEELVKHCINQRKTNWKYN